MIKPTAVRLESLEARVARIAGVIDQFKGEQIAALDLRGLADFADAFVIATVRSRTHLAALADHLIATLRADGIVPFQPPDLQSARWVAIDFGDVVVHLMDAATRVYYNLEALWGDADPLAWERTATP